MDGGVMPDWVHAWNAVRGLNAWGAVPRHSSHEMFSTHRLVRQSS